MTDEANENKGWGPFKKKPNILIIMTDQQRSIQHFPEGWAEKHLPYYTTLQEHGVTYINGMTNSTACSPSRATLFTGTYPSLHGVKKVCAELYLNNTLPIAGKLTTLGQIMQRAGYQVAYKGKWHMNEDFVETSRVRPLDPYQQQVENQTMETRYFFPNWNSPDYGTEETINESTPVAPGFDSFLTSLGGANPAPDGSINREYAANDYRNVHASDTESAIDFMVNWKRRKDENEKKPKKDQNPEDDKPFCVIVSLSNPHDIWVYPYSYQLAGYEEKYWKNDHYNDFKLPKTYTENLARKPACQQNWVDNFQEGRLDNENDVALDSVKFYAYLHTIPEKLTEYLLNTLHDQGLNNDTLIIRLADHGEMGLAHGGLRQKENQCYRETLNVPMIFSRLPDDLPKKHDPEASPLPQPKSDRLIGLIDIIPTLADIVGIKDEIGMYIEDLEKGIKDLGQEEDAEYINRHKYAVIQGRSFADDLEKYFLSSSEGDNRANYRITERSLEILALSKVSVDVLEKLRSLIEDNKVKGESDFLSTIKERINDDKLFELYKSVILRATEILDESNSVPKQLHFATDDAICFGDVTTTSIRAIVEKDWKYAVYYTADYDTTKNPNGVASNFEYELYSYNHFSDDLEMNNLLNPDPQQLPPSYLNAFVYGERKRLHDALTKLMEENHTKPQNWPVID